MNYNQADEYAIRKASDEFGSDVLSLINEKEISSFNGKWKVVLGYVKALTEFFETQHIQLQIGAEKQAQEFHNYVKGVIEGEDENDKGIVGPIKSMFLNLRRDEQLGTKKAASLYLIYYLEYIKDNAFVTKVENLFTLKGNLSLDGKYFDKDYVFGELIEVVKEFK